MHRVFLGRQGTNEQWHKEVESRKVWACLAWFSCRFLARRNSTTSGYQWESVGRKIKLAGAVSMARGRNAICCSCPGVDYRQKEGRVHSHRLNAMHWQMDKSSLMALYFPPNLPSQMRASVHFRSVRVLETEKSEVVSPRMWKSVRVFEMLKCKKKARPEKGKVRENWCPPLFLSHHYQ